MFSWISGRHLFSRCNGSRTAILIKNALKIFRWDIGLLDWRRLCSCTFILMTSLRCNSCTVNCSLLSPFSILSLGSVKIHILLGLMRKTPASATLSTVLDHPVIISTLGHILQLRHMGVAIDLLRSGQMRIIISRLLSTNKTHTKH